MKLCVCASVWTECAPAARLMSFHVNVTVKSTRHAANACCVLEDVRSAFYSTDCVSATDSGIASEVPLNLFHVVLTLILAQLVSALRAA